MHNTKFAPHFANMLERHAELEHRPGQSQPGDSRAIAGQPIPHEKRNATLFMLRIRKREPRRYYFTQAISARYPRGWLYERVQYVVTGTQYNVCEWDWASDDITVRHIAGDRKGALREMRRLARGD